MTKPAENSDLILRTQITDELKRIEQVIKPLVQRASSLTTDATALAAAVAVVEADVAALASDVAALTAQQSLAEKSTTNGSGTDYQFTGISSDEAVLVMEGLSHNSGSDQSLRLFYSTDGSAWTQLGSDTFITGASAAGLSINGMVSFKGLKSGRFWVQRIGGAGAFPILAVVSDAAANVGSQIVGLRIQWTGGSIDAGTVRLMTPGGL